MSRTKLCATAFAGALLTAGLAGAMASAQPASAAVAAPAAVSQPADDPGAGSPYSNPGDYVGGPGSGSTPQINTGYIYNNQQLSGCALWLPAGGCSGVGFGQ